MKNFIFKVFFALLFLGNLYNLNGQCLPLGITFNTQQQIDDFPTNYPGCIIIEGYLDIQGFSNITNLNGLSQIVEIGGYLSIISSFSLDDLSGLDNLQSVGGYL